MNALAKKLLIKPDTRWLIYNTPAAYIDELAPLPAGVNISLVPDSQFDGIQLFVKNSAELTDSLKIIIPALRPDTIFWVIYPKKSSKIPSDLEMMSSWEQLGKYGLRGVAAAAIDETWTALRFRPEGQSKTSSTSNKEIAGNEYSKYIDITNKRVILPEDIAKALQQHAQAMQFYQGLSYSNRKEYVLWILSARQEKTRIDRLNKMVEKLKNGKKNPAEK